MNLLSWRFLTGVCLASLPVLMLNSQEVLGLADKHGCNPGLFKSTVNGQIKAAHLCFPPRGFGGFVFKLLVHSSNTQQELRLKLVVTAQSVIPALGRYRQEDWAT